MRVGIIGYGSMGKMLLAKFSESGIGREDLSVSNRTLEKLSDAKDIAVITDNKGVAKRSGIVFVCVRPSDLKSVIEEIREDRAALEAPRLVPRVA
jgi:pyrroline-5-carboxylate reductase